MKIEMFGIRLGEISPGDDLPGLIVNEARQSSDGIQEGDIVVITSKIISKSRGLLIELKNVKPSKKALRISKVTGTDSRHIQAILDNSDDVFFIVPVYRLVKGACTLEKVSTDRETAWRAVEETVQLATVRGHRLCGNAGLDTSNHPEGIASIPPKNSDEVAQEIRREITRLTGNDVAVIITDTGWYTRLGTLDVAIGVSGIQVNARKLGERDSFGRIKYGGMDSVVDEIACAAVLMMGQAAEGVPAVIMRGYNYQKSEERIADYTFSMKAVRKVLLAIFYDSTRALGLGRLFRMFIQ